MTIVVTVRNQLPEVLTLVTERVGAGLGKLAFDVEAQAKQRAPVDTGFLRSAIQAEVLDPRHALVTSFAFYSVYQEFGTYKMSAQPYMVPAVEAVAPTANQFFRDLA